MGGSLPQRSIVVEPIVSSALQQFAQILQLFYCHLQGPAALATSIEFGASCTSGDINTLLSQIENMGLQR